MTSPYLFTATALAASGDGLSPTLMFVIFMVAFFGVLVALIRRGRENTPGTRESVRRRLAEVQEDDIVDDHRQHLRRQRQDDDLNRP